MTRKPAKVRYLLYNEGRYHARKGVPIALRSIVGKRELLHPLGADRKDAIFRLPGAVARFNLILADARLGMPPAPPPLSIPHAVHDLYQREVREDDRNRYEADRTVRPPEFNALYSGAHLHRLRKIAKGFITADDMVEGGLVEATIGWAIEEATTVQGKPCPALGTQLWINLARALCSAQVEAIERSIERDDGNDKGQPTYLPLTVPPPAPEQETAPISIMGLLNTYITMRGRLGVGAAAGKRWKPCFKRLVKFLKHDDAKLVTTADLNRWIEYLRDIGLSEKTIKSNDLASVKAGFGYAWEKQLLPSNPAQAIKIRNAPTTETRDKGFSDEEALALVRASRAYLPRLSDNHYSREGTELVGAKQWVPILCAFSGTRVGEMTQLRKQDVKIRDGIHYLHLTPDAGSIKNRKFRDVPIHQQLIDEGFLDFVAARSDGPLFFDDSKVRRGTAQTRPSQGVSDRLSVWIRTLAIVALDVAPNHGWRHRFKTIGRDVGIDQQMLDAIQGHASRTAGDAYGSNSLGAKAKAIALFPRFAL